MALSALLALFPAVLVERLLVTPLWRWLLRAQGRPSSTLDELLFTEARAVVEFHNGRGIVSTVHDSRSIQLAARLREDQALLPVKVGDRVRIVEVDAEKETVTVSVLDDSEVALSPAIKTSP